jgi:pyrroline-5-carboxylate reductase
LYASAGVDAGQRALAESILAAVGTTLWVPEESLLDPVTAISGSGPAYVFYFIEALQQAAQEMGFSAADAKKLAVETFVGSARLAAQSPEDVALLRERVTSKGGTTERALASMDADRVKDLIVRALHAANQPRTSWAENWARTNDGLPGYVHHRDDAKRFQSTIIDADPSLHFSLGEINA